MKSKNINPSPCVSSLNTCRTHISSCMFGKTTRNDIIQTWVAQAVGCSVSSIFLLLWLVHVRWCCHSTEALLKPSALSLEIFGYKFACLPCCHVNTWAALLPLCYTSPHSFHEWSGIFTFLSDCPSFVLNHSTMIR
ncbi:hypothetical protein XENORESO_006046 [Xenotaenia resolanae]|uniref:Uncharacterized protein n=1 Tax=Xenotaenia resolanae TaxID=208358 RepID=A0ABV0WDX4_9TELE